VPARAVIFVGRGEGYPNPWHSTLRRIHSTTMVVSGMDSDRPCAKFGTTARRMHISIAQYPAGPLQPVNWHTTAAIRSLQHLCLTYSTIRAWLPPDLTGATQGGVEVQVMILVQTLDSIILGSNPCVRTGRITIKYVRKKCKCRSANTRCQHSTIKYQLFYTIQLNIGLVKLNFQ
jgi:hypothetical protein